MLENKKIVENIKFTSELNSFLDEHFTEMFDQAVALPENAEFSDNSDSEDLLDMEEENGELIVTVNDSKVKNKIAAILLEDRIQNYLFSMAHETSKNTDVGGYV